MSKTRSALGSLSSFVNVNGDKSLTSRVGPERTQVERHTIRMYERGQETWRRLNRDRVAAFIELFLLCIVYGENGHHRGSQHPVTSKLLKKTLAKCVIPFIDRRLVFTLNESMWIITMEQFEELDHYLVNHPPRVHAGQHWQNIVYFLKKWRRRRTGGGVWTTWKGRSWRQ